MGRQGPRRPSARRYLEVGGAALEGLRAAIWGWPDCLLRGLAEDWDEELAL